MRECTKKWKNQRDKQVCPQKTDHINKQEARKEFLFCLLAAYETLGDDPMILYQQKCGQQCPPLTVTLQSLKGLNQAFVISSFELTTHLIRSLLGSKCVTSVVQLIFCIHLLGPSHCVPSDVSACTGVTTFQIRDFLIFFNVQED